MYVYRLGYAAKYRRQNMKYKQSFGEEMKETLKYENGCGESWRREIYQLTKSSRQRPALCMSSCSFEAAQLSTSGVNEKSGWRRKAAAASIGGVAAWRRVNIRGGNARLAHNIFWHIARQQRAATARSLAVRSSAHAKHGAAAKQRRRRARVCCGGSSLLSLFWRVSSAALAAARRRMPALGTAGAKKNKR
jgi:hypothetical protein